MPDKDNPPSDNSGKMPDLSIEGLENSPVVLPFQKLNIPGIAILLSKGHSQSSIARIYGVSPQAVSQFIQNNSDELLALKDYDNVIVSKLKQQVLRVIDSIDKTDIKKAGLLAKNAFIGTMIDKTRLIEGKSNINISNISKLCIELDKHDSTPPDTRYTEGAE